MKRLAIVLLLSALMTTSVYANSAHEQAMSFILADQDKPRTPGDRLYTSENMEMCPVLLDTTAYHSGEYGSHGDKMQRGHVAFMESAYGTEMELYEAVLEDDGSYTLGPYIGRYQVKDTGYGRKSTKYNAKSRVRPDKSGIGTIETGETVDVFCPTYSECKEWMKFTQGKVFALFITDAKG